MIEILAHSNLAKLLSTIVTYLPSITNGTGCSIFLRHEFKPEKPAVMVASSEIPDLVSEAEYEPGSGLTGYVLKTGVILNINRGPGARSTEQLKKIDKNLSWDRKYESRDKSGIQYDDEPFLACPIFTQNGDVIGVIRIASRVNGNFTANDERAIKACANTLGGVVDQAGINKTFTEVKNELITEVKKEVRNEVRSANEALLLGQREIMYAIRKSPHSFILLLSKSGFLICVLFWLLYHLFGINLVNPGLAVFGCFAFLSYWLMGKVAEGRIHRELLEKD